MPYSIVETPDHLHRGLHLFAASNVKTVLDWLDIQLAKGTIQERRLPTEERWLLGSLDSHGLTADTRERRLLARKEAQEFFKKHPEMRKGASYRTTPYPSEYTGTDYEERGHLEEGNRSQPGAVFSRN